MYEGESQNNNNNLKWVALMKLYMIYNIIAADLLLVIKLLNILFHNTIDELISSNIFYYN